MAEVTWTSQALDDVELIRAFVARDSPHYANMLVEELLQAVERLEQFPYSGRCVPELEDDHLREVVHGSYRIVYKVVAEAVDVLTVVHGARRLPGPRSG